MDYLKKSLDVFFESSSGVIVLRGDWGVGKTYFWDDYITSRIQKKDLTQIAYSYVSLFGRNSLADIRASIFQNGRAIASDDKIVKSFEVELEKSSTLYSKFPKVKSTLNFAKAKAPWLGFITGHAKKMPMLDKFSGLMSSFEYGLVNNYVVCFDDIERKGSGLSIKEFMGLADELAQRKSCKVVMIFNDKSFDKGTGDLEQFESYREKVVDAELLYNPSCEANFDHVFSSELDHCDYLKSIVLKVGVKNIRVLRKLKALLNAHASFLENKNSALVREFYLHAAVLCSSYYLGGGFISYSDLRSSLAAGSWASYLTASADSLTEGQLAFKNINVDLQMSESKFDSQIGSYLERGYVEDEAVSAVFADVEEHYRKSSVDAELRSAWKIYHDSFGDDEEEFKKRLKNVFDKELKTISLSDFSSAIDMLEDLGESVDSYIEEFMVLHKDGFQDDSFLSSWHLDRVKNNTLRAKVVEAGKAGKSFNIDDISWRIGTERSWSPEDIAYLASMTADDYVQWLRSSPKNLTTKLRSGLLSFRNLSTANKDDSIAYTSIGDAVVEALRIVGADNKLNAIRVENMYGIK
ncbi:P-loop NTPase fold protein [Pseudomonas sp. H1_A05]